MENKDRLREYISRKKHPVFIPYFSLGDPSLEESESWATALVEGGADILEIGLPFSDPVADGPVIQKSYGRALKNGFTMDKALSSVYTIHKRHPDVPIILLTYFNLIFNYNPTQFLTKASEAGVYGLVIPDLPFDTEEFASIQSFAYQKGISIIDLVTPATTKERMREMKKNASGFIYFVTSFGVTGERVDFARNLREKIESAKKNLALPVCAGFGISTKEQAEQIGTYADGIIIGSAIQKIIESKSNMSSECFEELKRYCGQIKGVLEKINT